ncbi:lipocalin-like domain-containing protein [Psychroserpens damuponensis]|uniref:lipocalin family protein n=1 Tax=Psychroserpens damuponensis TaxID=943936 RepID=UPI00058B52D0|nr:lipocalin family protein [Psychroserpens damuponensis]
MKKNIRFYVLFSLITVLFSCSNDNDTQDVNEDNGLTIIRHVEPVSPNTIAPKSTYVDNTTNNQLTSYFKHDSAGNIERLTHIVSDDGSGISTIMVFNGVGEIQSLYQQNGLTGDIFNEVFIGFEDGVTLYGGEDGVNQLTASIQMNTVGNFLNSQDDVLFSQAINQNLGTFEHFAYVSSSNGNNRASLNTLVFVAVMAGIAVLYSSATIEQGIEIIPKSTAGMVQCDMFGDCSNNRSSSNNGDDSCSIPYTDFVCSEVVDLDENSCENSTLEVIVGVDPDNLLVAIVNGDSANYDFYWSTGDMSTELIGHSITAPGDGNYYVMVIDDYGCVAFGSATVGSEYEHLIIGTWRANSVLFNGGEIFNPDCVEKVVFTSTNFSSQDLGNCDEPESTGGNYNITGNTIDLNFTEGDFSGNVSQQIIELTETSMVVAEGNNYVYSYERMSIDVFGPWNLQEMSNCVSTGDGGSSSDNYTGTITLNEDYTVTAEDDSGGNYVTNNFTFENNILIINTVYHDYFTPSCGGVDFKVANYTAQYTYDPLTDSFDGSFASSQEEVTGDDCVENGNNCSGTGNLTR